MKLTKALKTKNSIIAEIQRLKEIITKNNVVLRPNAHQYNIQETYSKLVNKVKDLAKLKKDISVANNGIYESIFLLAELKGLIEFLNSIDTTDGVSEREDFRQGTITIVHNAAIKDSDKKNFIEMLIKDIEVLQDVIDEYNATKEI